MRSTRALTKDCAGKASWARSFGLRLRQHPLAKSSHPAEGMLRFFQEVLPCLAPKSLRRAGFTSALLSVMLLSALGASSTPVALADTTATTPIVFIHGIKGSELQDVEGSTEWVTAAQAMGLSTPHLSLPLQWIPDGTQARDSITATAPLKRVRILPLLIQEDIYGPWLEAAEKSGRAFYPFAYDWRRDNLETVAQFESFIREILKRHPGQKAQVVAHSMGGLITLALLNQKPELFHSVAFVGVPFKGGIGFLRDMHEGESIGLNSKILSPDVLFTFPSVYTLFPLSGDGLAEREGTPIPMDFFSAQSWFDKKLGIFAEGSPYALSKSSRFERDRRPEVALKFLTQALERAKAFREQIRLAPKVSYPPILVVTSKKTETRATVYRAGPESEYGWDFETAKRLPGDGRVLEVHSTPPTGIPFQTLYSDAEHSKLLNDPAVIERLLKDY